LAELPDHFQERTMGIGRTVANGASIVAIGAVVVLAAAAGVAVLVGKCVNAWADFLVPPAK
jgi:hypothetical protein